MPRAIRLSEAMTDYRLHLQARGLGERTVKNALQPLNRAISEWGDLNTTSITGTHIDRIFRSAEWSPATRNLYLGNMRQFFTWCRRENLISRDFDPTDGWRNQRVPRIDKMRLPMEEFPDLLNAARHPRDRMICALGIYTFCRGSEIQTLTWENVDLARHSLGVYRHKTRESDTLPISTELAEEIVRWQNWYRRDRHEIRGNWYLTPSKAPNPTRYNPTTRRIEVTGEFATLRPDRVATHPYRSVQRALAVLGYDTRGEGEHTLRRSGARALFDTLREQGYDGALMRVSSMLGHRDTRVTERYIGLSLERQQRNEMIAGRIMFPGITASAEVTLLRAGSA